MGVYSVGCEQCGVYIRYIVWGMFSVGCGVWSV